MRYSFLTPHQYEPLSSFIDTWIVSSQSPWPLDISTPHAASQFVNARIMDILKERFMGRTRELDLGTTLTYVGLDRDFLSKSLSVLGSAKYCILITERLLVREKLEWSADGVRWLAVDWWQWYRRRIEPSRQPDAWLYLSLANPFYQSSFEFRQTGIAVDVAHDMAKQGEALIRQFSAYVGDIVASMWKSADDT